MAKKTEVVEVTPLALKRMTITLVADSALMVHRFSAKAEAQIMVKQFGIKLPKELRKPEDDYIAALYFIDKDGHELPEDLDSTLITRAASLGDDKGDEKKDLLVEFFKQHRVACEKRREIKNPIYGFPANGIKQCAVRGAKSQGMNMTDARRMFNVPLDFVKIIGTPEMVSHNVTIGQGGHDIRFRPSFMPWKIEVPIIYATLIQNIKSIIIESFNWGGFGTGIGEWRPEKNGQMGTFHAE